MKKILGITKATIRTMIKNPSDTLVQFIKNLNNDQIFNMLSLVLKWFLTNTSAQSSPTNTQTLNNSGISSILPILLEVLTTNNNTNSI